MEINFSKTLLGRSYLGNLECKQDDLNRLFGEQTTVQNRIDEDLKKLKEGLVPNQGYIALHHEIVGMSSKVTDLIASNRKAWALLQGHRAARTLPNAQQMGLALVIDEETLELEETLLKQMVVFDALLSETDKKIMGVFTFLTVKLFSGDLKNGKS